MERVPLTDNADAVRRAAAERFPTVTKTADYTVLESDHGTYFFGSAAGAGVTFTLPAPRAGLVFTFAKANATTDLFVQCANGEKINFGTADKMYKSVTDGDGVPVTVTVFSDGTDWFVLGQVGTWANDNS